MKECPNCLKRHRNSKKFCDGCGTSLEHIPELPDDLTAFADQARSVLHEQMKKAGAAAAVGLEKAKWTIETGREKIQTGKSQHIPAGYTPAAYTDVSSNSQPGGGWEHSVNPDDAASVEILRYPFFKEEDEKTIAVLGGEAVAADLKGNYRMPYAVLTEKHLYCKNEAGNFEVEASNIQHVEDNQTYRYGWMFMLAMIFPTFLGIFALMALLNMLSMGQLAGGLIYAVCLGCYAAICYFYHRREVGKTMVALIALIFLWGVVLV